MLQNSTKPLQVCDALLFRNTEQDDLFGEPIQKFSSKDRATVSAKTRSALYVQIYTMVTGPVYSQLYEDVKIHNL